MNNRPPVIVVVDPDAEYSTALSALLDQRGYRAVRRSCGIDALNSIKEDPPALVLSEISLLDCDPREFLESVRSISPSTPILLMSHGPHSEHSTSGWSERVFRLSTLPDKADPILNAVDRLLQGAA